MFQCMTMYLCRCRFAFSCVVGFVLVPILRVYLVLLVDVLCSLLLWMWILAHLTLPKCQEMKM